MSIEPDLIIDNEDFINVMIRTDGFPADMISFCDFVEIRKPSAVTTDQILSC